MKKYVKLFESWYQGNSEGIGLLSAALRELGSMELGNLIEANDTVKDMVLGMCRDIFDYEEYEEILDMKPRDIGEIVMDNTDIYRDVIQTFEEDFGTMGLFDGVTTIEEAKRILKSLGA